MSPFSAVPGDAPDTIPPEGAASRRGIVALGDSITVGEGEPLLGVRMQSWASWVAEAFDVPAHILALNGARARDAHERLAPRMRGRYDAALVYVGLNDARSLDWSGPGFGASLGEILSRTSAHADHTIVVAPPDDVGRPSCAPKSGEASAIVRSLAAIRGASVLDLADFGGRRMVLPDVVHLTALGQVELAERTVAILENQGLRRPDGEPPIRPWTLAEPNWSTRARLAAERRWARGQIRDWRRRAVEQISRRL